MDRSICEEGPVQGEAPYVGLVVEVSGGVGGGVNGPVEGGEGWAVVVEWDVGGDG